MSYLCGLLRSLLAFSLRVDWYRTAFAKPAPVTVSYS
jgi:hypothetical protein